MTTHPAIDPVVLAAHLARQGLLDRAGGLDGVPVDVVLVRGDLVERRRRLAEALGGTPEQVAKVTRSYTGQYLRKML